MWKGIPCPAGEAFRAEYPDFMSDADWEFMLAYGCSTLEMFASGIFPGAAQMRKASVTMNTVEPGNAGPELTQTNQTYGMGELDPVTTSTESAEASHDEMILYDPDAKAPAQPDEPGIVAVDAVYVNPEVVAMQEDFVAAGCAHDVLPERCLKHPYYLKVLSETGENGWSEAP